MRSSSAVPGGLGWSACHTMSRAPTRRCRESRAWYWSAPRYQVAFFAYPNQPSLLVPTKCEVITLAKTGQDLEGALEALARELDAPTGYTQFVAQRERPGLPHGKVTPQGIAAILVALIPEQAIVVDESITVGHSFFLLPAVPHRTTG